MTSGLRASRAPKEDEIPYLGLLTVAEHMRRGELSSEEVVRALLARIERYDAKLHSFALVMHDVAISQACQADGEINAGHWRGPLHGVPIGIKDLLDVEGVPTGSGTEVLKNYIPGADATVVARLRRAGAVIIGKLHMTEGATLAHHPSLPRPNNPWHSDYWTGVSSSGSGVATAAGFCFGALGTDTGGSIRMPSAACGLSGIKPTWGRVSRHGLFPLAESFDHVGPMARSAADAAAILQIIAGEDPADPTTLPGGVPDYLAELGGGIRGLSIGVDRAVLEANVDPLVIDNVKQAIVVLRQLGARIREVTCPSLASVLGSVMPLMVTEVVVAHAATYPLHADRYGPDLKRMLDSGAAFTATDIARALHSRAAFSGALRKLFDDVDLLLTPAAPAPTPTWNEIEALADDLGAVLDRVGRYTFPFNVSGNPTLSLPSGFAPTGLPLGIQLIGPHRSEALLCRAGHAFQQATGFHVVHPRLECSQAT
jgi:amidase